MEPHIVAARDLDRAGGEHAGAGGGHLEHLVEADARQLAGAGDDARVGGVDAEDVRVDLAVVRAERGGEGDGGRVGAAPAERRHLECGRDALEAGDEHDRAFVERLVDPACTDLDDLGLAVHGVGDDSGLRPGERDRFVAEVVDHHRRERAGDPLADRDEHVELARMRHGGDLAGEVEQLVGRVPHRREDADDAMPVLACGDEPRGHALQLLGVADGRAAELHHDRAEVRRLRVGVDRRNDLVVGRRHAGECRQTPGIGPKKTLNRRTRGPVGSDGGNLEAARAGVKDERDRKPLFARNLFRAAERDPDHDPDHEKC